MNNETHIARCIDTISLTKRRDPERRCEELDVRVTLRRAY